MTKLKTIAIAVAAIVFFSTATNAQAVNTSYAANFEEPLKVKYLGEDKGYLLFRVTVQSPAASVFAINDRSEGELYSSYFSDNVKVQTVKIEKRNNQELNFKLISGKKTYSKSFLVNTKSVETTTVAEGDITRL